MPQRRLKVLHLIPSMRRGGAETVVVNLCNRMDAGQFEMGICSLTDDVPLLSVLQHPMEVRVFKYAQRPGRHLLSNHLAALRAVRQAIQTFRPDIVHSHLHSTIALAQGVSSLGLGVSSVLTIHAAGLHYIQQRNLRAAAFRALESVNAWLSGATVIAVSKAVEDVVHRKLHIPRKKILMIYNGVDEAKWSRGENQPIPREEFGCLGSDLLVVCVARFVAEKGHALLIKSWQTVAANLPNARLLLVGDGPLRNDIESLVRRQSLASSVRFLGWRDDVANVLASADVGVVSSLSEGLPIGALELMSMELPVVGTMCSGLREVVEHNKTGLLVPIGQSELLAEGLIAVLRNKNIQKTFGTAGRRRVREHFSLNLQAAKHAELYSRLTRSRRRST